MGNWGSLLGTGAGIGLGMLFPPLAPFSTAIGGSLGGMFDQQGGGVGGNDPYAKWNKRLLKYRPEDFVIGGKMNPGYPGSGTGMSVPRLLGNQAEQEDGGMDLFGALLRGGMGGSLLKDSGLFNGLGAQGFGSGSPMKAPPWQPTGSANYGGFWAE